MIFVKAFVFLLLCFGIAVADTDTTAVSDSVSDSIAVVVADTAAVAVADTAAVADTVAVIDTAPVIVADLDSVKIKPGLHFFVSVGAQFIDFNRRLEFVARLDTQYFKHLEDYFMEPTGVLPIKQDFQTVNLTFPLTIGALWQFSDMHSLGLGAGILYSNESVILTDKNSGTHNFRYVLLAYPLFAEYRLQISPDLFSLRNGDYFSVFVRYYWMLPGTEIYSSWGNASADFDPLGNGYGIFLGYRFAEWMGLSLWGEMGFLDLDIKSSDKDAILDSWNLGGISISVRLMF
ncbi:MAG: hypothetical protein LBU89_07200 [Fibromonadaceae bacterium]|jgi:hypothetical protein|nr:hypothetical protein [Fibromonadaceae bacterium]